MQKRKDGEFLTSVDKTLLKLKSKRGKIPFNFLTAKESLPLRKQGMISFDEKRKTWVINSKGKERMKLLEGNTSKAINIILESLASQGHNSLLLLDIDDTLVTAQNIFIYKKSPDGKEEALTPNEFAEENTREEKEKGYNYDFREFRDADKVAGSIKTGLPLLSNLKIMDNYISNGWTIGVLTARGMEEVISNTMREWLKFRDTKTGKLKSASAKLARRLVFAVSDDTKRYEGADSFEKKANVIKRLANQFDRVWLLDDDVKNIEAVNNLNIKNVKAIKAKA